MNEKYFLLSPFTDTGLSRAMVYYCLFLTNGGLFIFLKEGELSPKSMSEDISAVLLDLIHLGVENLDKAPIIFKNGVFFDGIAIDSSGDAHFYSLGAKSEREAIQSSFKRKRY